MSDTLAAQVAARYKTALFGDSLWDAIHDVFKKFLQELFDATFDSLESLVRPSEDNFWSNAGVTAGGANEMKGFVTLVRESADPAHIMLTVYMTKDMNILVRATFGEGRTISGPASMKFEHEWDTFSSTKRIGADLASMLVSKFKLR